MSGSRLGIILGLVIVVLLGVFLIMRTQNGDDMPRDYRNHQSAINTLLEEDELNQLQGGERQGRVVEVFDINNNGYENILFATGVGGVHSNEFEIWEYDGDDYYPLLMRYPSGETDTARLSEGNSVFFALHFEIIPEEQLLVQYQRDTQADEICTASLYVWNHDEQFFEATSDDAYADLIEDSCTIAL